MNWKMIQDYFWTGTGLGSFERMFLWYQVQYAPELTGHSTCSKTGTYCFAHNDPLQFFAEMGVFPFVFFYAACFYYLSKTKNYIPAAAIAVIIIHSHFTFNFYIPAIGVLIGLAGRKWIINK